MCVITASPLVVELSDSEIDRFKMALSDLLAGATDSPDYRTFREMSVRHPKKETAMSSKLGAWTVVLQWDCGGTTINTTIAPDTAAAAAITTIGALRGDPAPTGALVACCVVPIDAEWLRWAIGEIDRGGPELKLVPVEAQIIPMVPRFIKSPPEVGGAPYCAADYLAPTDPAA